MGLMVILSFMLRSISTAGMYGLVRAEIPLISVPVEDPTHTNYSLPEQGQISETTPLSS